VTQLLIDYGLVLLFVLVAIESAGIPVPGETGLITAAFLAHQGHYSIVWVIVVAAVGAIAGDNIGYWLGRLGGRRLLERWSITRRYAEKTLPRAEAFFRRHGSKTVFFGRFIAILRVTAAWMAGISHMHWWLFALWNALGGILWATGIGLLAYFAGKAAADAVSRYGLYAVVAILVVGALGFVVLKLAHRRLEGSDGCGGPGDGRWGYRPCC
jgi:membrane protein DedA with SNARE-associated domain